MPRYNNVDTIIFTDSNGTQTAVKDRRLISLQVFAFEIELKSDNYLDEIASRQSVYGRNGEQQSWKLFDLNIVKLTEARFDLSKLKRLKIATQSGGA